MTSLARSELLRPFYMNHVHNDWLELALTGGVPAMLLVVVALIAYGVRLTRTLMAGAERGEELVMRRLGLVMLLLLALASVTDYPLRTPAFACLAAIAIVLAFTAPAAPRSGDGTGKGCVRPGRRTEAVISDGINGRTKSMEDFAVEYFRRTSSR